MAKATFNVTAQSENPTKTVVRARDFEMIIDEPRNLKGTDHGPNPVEYILGALAGCLNVVGHLVAQELGIELRSLKFELAGDLDPAKFAGQETTSRSGYQEIRVSIHADCDATEDQMLVWLKAVEERCPVSDNLANTTPIKIELTSS